MEMQGWFTLCVGLLVVVGLALELAGPDLVMLAGLFTLAAVGILTPAETFSGFSNPAMATVGALFVVSAAVRQTGILERGAGPVFQGAGGERGALLRMCPPLAGASAFLNNAPIVAMATPVVLDWSRRHGLTPSRLLIPLSYATILGSTLTMIGTSVNLTVAGLMEQTPGLAKMEFFTLAPVGLPVCFAGLLYLFLVAPRLLPSRLDPAGEVDERRREYVASMRVEAGCTLIGQSVESAGLRQLPGLFLVEIDRGGRAITPVGPFETLEEGDRLVFAGVVSTIVDLQRIPGLVPVGEDEESEPLRAERHLIEAVISSSSPLVNVSVRDADFRGVYAAAVIAVHRNGERVGGKIGEIVLRPGDTLLMQARSRFLRLHRNSPDFYLVSEVASGGVMRPERTGIALAILAAMMVAVVTGAMKIYIASFLAAGALLATRCISRAEARRSVDLSVLLVIAAGLGMAQAMEKTGAAAAIAGLLVGGAGEVGPLATLAVVYGATVLMSELLHHAAAAAIMFPIAVAAAGQLGVEPQGFVMGIAIAATCAFANPVTYQTHLIVYGPGGYRFTDFVKVGLPLDLVCGAVAVTMIPWIWPF